MKNHFKRILIIALCSFFSTTLVAQHVGNIYNFTILPQYLLNGKLKVSSTATTTIKYTVEFARTAYSYSPTTLWNTFEMNVALSTAAANNTLTLFNQPVKITNTDFPANNNILVKEFTVSINNSQLREGVPLYVAYTLNKESAPIYAYSNKGYLPDFSNAGGDNGGVYQPPIPILQIPNTEYNKRFVVPETSGLRRFYNAGGTVRVATNGNYRMDFQADGNLVLYNGTNPIWASKSNNVNGMLTFQHSGHVNVGNLLGTSFTFSASVPSSTNVIWVIQDDGNFVCYPGYYLDAQNNVIVTGTPIMATMTQGGKKSNRSGKLT